MKSEIIETFVNMAIEEMNEEVINRDLLMDRHIKAYLIEKIMQKATNYPQFLNIEFKDQKDFDRFNRNLKGEIYRLFLTLTRAAKVYIPGKKNKLERKLEKAIISFLDLKNCFTASLNTVISQDGKATELIDLIPAKKWETYNESAGMFDEDEIEEDEIKIKAKYQKRQPEQATKNLQTAFAF